MTPHQGHSQVGIQVKALKGTPQFKSSVHCPQQSAGRLLISFLMPTAFLSAHHASINMCCELCKQIPIQNVLHDAPLLLIVVGNCSPTAFTSVQSLRPSTMGTNDLLDSQTVSPPPSTDHSAPLQLSKGVTHSVAGPLLRIGPLSKPPLVLKSSNIGCSNAGSPTPTKMSTKSKVPTISAKNSHKFINSLISREGEPQNYAKLGADNRP